MARSIRIASREYKLTFDKRGGASFGSDDSGRDEIRLGLAKYLNDHLHVKVLDALLSSGFFKLIDGKPKKAVKSKG